MATEGTIQTLLKTLVSNRCYPIGEVPDNPTAPYIVYQVISNTPYMLNESKKKRMQVDVYASRYESSKAVEASVISAMRSASFANTLINSQDAYDSDVKLNRQIIEFFIWE